VSPSRRNVCYPLAEDPELAEAIDLERRVSAVASLAARELSIPTGDWAGNPVPVEGGIGLLVLQGVLVHRIGIDNRYGAELLGEGDVLRAVGSDQESSPLALSSSWLVLEPTRLAVLDERFTRQLAAFPSLSGCLFARAVLRTRQLAVNMAIVQQARVDVRLHMLLWHLAGRWGRVRADGVVVPLHLTHAILADLVAARRPTVSSAVSELARAGLVRSVAEGWLLIGEPPGRLSPSDAPAALPGASAGTGMDATGRAAAPEVSARRAGRR
jgi:CRP/FNR family cyclic AMP-dependent transcriptional regulator